MTTEEEQLQSIVYFLSDHVCTSLEASEAILAEAYEPEAELSALTADEILHALDDFNAYIDKLRHYEYLIITRLNQARHWATQLRQIDSDFRPVIDLFSTTTNIVSDASALLGEDENDAFNGDGEHHNFIQTRQLLVTNGNDANAPKHVFADENYLFGGKVLLISLMEVCESFHTALEARYSAFSEEKEGEKKPEGKADPEEDPQPAPAKLISFPAAAKK